MNFCRMKQFFIGVFVLCFGISLAQEDALYKFRDSEKRMMKSHGLDATPLQQKYDVIFYGIDLAMENTSTYLDGSVTIRAKILSESLDTFAFHLHSSLLIDSILFSKAQNINVVSFASDTQTAERFAFLTGVKRDDLIDIQVFYHGLPQSKVGFLAGISHGTYGRSSIVWTLSEPRNAYTWMPVKQDLNDKADSAWIFVTTSDTNKVASNGLLTRVVQLKENKVRYEWKTNYPIAYYLLSIALAEYYDYSFYCKPYGDEGDSILIQNYLLDAFLDEEVKERERENVFNTDTIMKALIHFYGAYPFSKEKYGHASAPMGGGMEHQTMSTMGGYDFWIVAHELAHQWFGDNVTCATWNDIWINEGFATYGECLVDEFVFGKAAGVSNIKTNIRNVLGYAKSGSVYVPEAEIGDESRIFSSLLSYDKGSCLVHMIRCELNDDEMFRNIIQGFQKEYAHKSVTGDDFQRYLSKASAKDFSTFFEQWYYGEGYPIANIEVQRQADIKDYVVNIVSVQTGSTEKAPFFTIDMDLLVKFEDGTDTIITLRQDKERVECQYAASKRVKAITFDPNVKLLAEARIQYVTLNNVESDPNTMVSVYPNPFDEQIRISFGSENTSMRRIYLRDFSGRILAETNRSGSLITLSTEHLAKGVYFIHIETEKGIVVRKIIKAN